MAQTQNRTVNIAKAASNKGTGSEIQKKAYELYVKRGKRPGYAMDDWLEAERLLKCKARF